MDAPAAAHGTSLPALRACWHPVAFGEQVGDAPYGTTLLGESLVVWRDSGRVAHAMRDLCLHRGTALSLGSVQGDEIVCPYHGWRFRSDGTCACIPQLEDQRQIPARARAERFRCVERYNLIWVALDEPRWPLPEVPEMERPGWVNTPTGPFAWRCDASRQVENFTDFAHFPFVHPHVLGDPERTVVPPHTVRVEGSVLHYEFERPQPPNAAGFPVFPENRTVRLTRYQLHLPFTIVVRMTWGGPESLVYLFASQPRTPDDCVGYCPIARNYNLEQPDALLQEMERLIFSQDQRVVESQRPEQVPFDLAAELHLKFDAVAIAYRRAMKAAGLA